MVKISNYQATLLGIGIIFDGTLISLPAQIIGAAKQSAWFAYPLAACVVLLALWLITRVMKRFPEQDLLQALVERFPFVGRVVTVLFLLFVFFILVRDLRSFVIFTIVALLPSTPLIAISLLTMLTVVLIVRGGTEVIARMTEVFLPILILAIISMPFFTLKEFEYKHLEPIFEQETWQHIINGAWLPLPYLGELLLLPLFLTSRSFTFRNGTYALLGGTLLLEILIVLNILVTGVQLSSRFMYPNHELVRQIRMTDFLDRFDLVFVSLWMPAMVTKIGYSLHIICRGMKQVASSLSDKELTSPVGLLAVVCSFWFFENSYQLLNLHHSWPLVGLLYQVLLPLLLFLFLRPKKRTT